MRTRVITDQSECFRVLLAADMHDKIKPSDPGKPGVFAMFPIDTIDGHEWCIADKKGDRYELLILSDITFEEAYVQFELISRRGKAANTAFVHFFQATEPSKN